MARRKTGRATREDRARETRNKILREATTLFARQGFHKTTVLDVASAIGMTQGALFHHFENKQQLLEAVVDRLARGMEAYRAELKGEATRASVQRVVRLMAEHFQRQPEATICLAALSTEFAGTGHSILARLRAVYEVFVGAFADVLALHPAVRNPRASAIVLIGAAQGLAVQGLFREGSPPLPDLAESFLRMLDTPDHW